MFENIDKEWKKLLDTPELHSILEDIKKNYQDEEIYPPLSQIFEFAKLTPLDKIRIVIIGQDPYPSKNTAHGLAFSSTGEKIPPSLKNIFQCLINDGYIDSMPSSANLTSWAKQGILLPNIALTTLAKLPGVHTKYWKEYIIKLITQISNLPQNIIFVLLGKNTQKLDKYINPKQRIIKCVHPSPSAQAALPFNRKFVNSRLFKNINEIYNNLYHDRAINWNIQSQMDIKINTNPARSWKPTTVVWFTDGSCTNNGKFNAQGGFAAVCTHGFCKNTVITGKLKKLPKPTNIRAECKAILSLLSYLEKNMSEWMSLIIFTDSLFWISMINEYMPKWAYPEDFHKKANPDLTKSLWNKWNKISGDGKELHIYHVYSHNKTGAALSKDPFVKYTYENNIVADELANKARALDDTDEHIFIL